MTNYHKPYCLALTQGQGLVHMIDRASTSWLLYIYFKQIIIYMSYSSDQKRKEKKD